MKVSNKIGKSLIAEFCGCNREILDNENRLTALLEEAIEKAGLQKLHTVVHKFQPQGVAALTLLAESHVSIHTWPEFGYAAVDIFTCGNSSKPWKALEHIKSELSPKKSEITEIDRGEIE